MDEEDSLSPHLLLPDSISQLEEFGRQKKWHKKQHKHHRQRQFNDLWVRIEDSWVSSALIANWTLHKAINSEFSLTGSFLIGKKRAEMCVCHQTLYCGHSWEETGRMADNRGIGVLPVQERNVDFY
ncbi:hypothetical protein BTVI_87635 [Pitangus sulphuratus]|nr:hypothetical protein BTVI_87635 [Pitangus sulphuratus]